MFKIFNQRYSVTAAPAAAAILLILCAIIYWPGLTGTFLFDDQANLANLQKIAAPLTWEQLTVFASSGSSGPLGRPLSMLTFGLQYQAWPADSGAFKLFNLALHLANGCLVFWLFVALGKASGKDKAEWLALLIAAVWLLHPIQVSTTLYIVQRMTLLATFFTLAGLIAFVEGRRLVAQGAPLKGYLLAGAGIMLGTALAITSKENGILLPLYALVIETTLLGSTPARPGWKKWKLFFLYLPLLLALAVLIFKFGAYTQYQGRGFTLTGRLLTEPRVVMDYLRKIFLLPPYNFGVFFDDYPLSHGVISPPETLLSVAGIFLLLVTAWLWRLRYPFYSFAVFWFFCGHLLESTVIPLELYFEHRNYLPSLGIIAGICYYVQGLITRPQKLRGLYRGLAAALFLAAIALTWQQTRLWGNSLVQAVVWAKEKPASLRSQERAGTMFALAGDAPRANEYFTEIGQKFPDSANGHLLQLYTGCHFGESPLPSMSEVSGRLAKAEKSAMVMSVLGEIVRLKEADRCASIHYNDVQALFEAALANPNFHDLQPNLLVLRGRAYMANGDLKAALASLDQAFSIIPNKEVAFQQMTWATQAGAMEQVREYARKARQAKTRNRLHDELINRQLPPATP